MARRLGAALLGAACGPVGCFILWRRMAYLGESVAHMGLLGAGLGLLIGVNALIGTAALAVAAALIMARASDRAIPAGTFVGIVGHMGLALGFIVLATMENVRADLLGYLFGDVLALSANDSYGVAAVSVRGIGVDRAVVAAAAAIRRRRRHFRRGRPWRTFRPSRFLGAGRTFGGVRFERSWGRC